MGNKIENFPTINEEAKLELMPKIEFETFYTERNFANKLEINRNEDVEIEEYYLDDPHGKWNPINNDLVLKGKIKISNTDCLFDKYKIAEKDTVLGVAITYISKKTSMCFSKSIGEITFGNKNEEFEFEFDFNKKQLAWRLNLLVQIYIKKANTIQRVLASIPGTIIGTIMDFDLVLEGTGSSFPIFINEMNNEPLWIMNCEIIDLNEVFSPDNISLVLNSNHPDFKYLGTEQISSKNSPLWKEILGTFFTTIILESKKQSDISTIRENEYEVGTIGVFVQYILDTFDIKTAENQVELSKIIRMNLDKVLR